MITTIAFDADDTLWINETYFRDAEDYFCNLLSDYISFEKCQKKLFDKEISNLPLYGYGIKPFTLSLIECAIEVTNGDISNETITKIMDMGKSMLNAPVDVIDGVEETLKKLSEKYRLVVATKGDLLDQERKLEKSGLSSYFHHIEVMSDKKPKNYTKLVQHLDIKPASFLMVGNSLKSDVLPVLEIRGHAYHIPFHTTWAHEQVDFEVTHKNFKAFENVEQLLNIL